MNRPEKIVTRHYGNGIINAAPSDRGFGHRSNAIFESEYTRSDIADARVVAAYEAAAREADDYMEPHVANGIRALTPADAKAAMEAVRRKARAEALREAAESCDTFDGPVSDSDFVNGQSTAAQQIRSAILALIDKETTE